MIFIGIMVFIGIAKKQGRRYWLHCLAAYGVQTAFHVCFNENYGGIVSRHITSNTASDMFWIIPVVVLGWATPIWLVRRGYTRPAPKVTPAE